MPVSPRAPSACRAIPSAWGGERPSFGGDGQPLSQRVASYDLTATLDPVKHTVDGTEHLRWLNRSDRPIQSLYFHLYLNGFEGQGSTFMTEKALYGAFRSGVATEKGEWGHVDLKSVTLAGKPATTTFVHPDGGPSTDHTVVRVDLLEAIAPGATGELDLVFHDQLPRVVARTGYFDAYHLIAQWFPKVGVLELPGERGATAPRWNCHEFHLFSEFYADFGNYRAELTAPKDYLVRATGVEQGAPKESAAGLTHTFAQDDVHDFVWTAWNGYAEPLEGRLRRSRAARTSTSRCSIRRSTPSPHATRSRGPSTPSGTSPRRSARTRTRTSRASCLRTTRWNRAAWSTRRSSRRSAVTGCSARRRASSPCTSSGTATSWASSPRTSSRSRSSTRA